MMGSAAIGAVSMGFVRSGDCGAGQYSQTTRGPDGQPIETCRARYGGFGGASGGFHGHGHAHGGG